MRYSNHKLFKIHKPYTEMKLYKIRLYTDSGGFGMGSCKKDKVKTDRFVLYTGGREPGEI
ncbi:hypothetical protein CS542_07715 [Pedobacter sp. IW39]|nr:hypothetical protein CS542_07715 [Pedobacter sp. IW39]